MIRAFIAITPPATLYQAFEEIRTTMQPQAFPWRWVLPPQVHLTLKFLGNVTPAWLEPLAQAMQQAVQGQARFLLQAQGIGCFPHVARPRVLWMGLLDPQQHLVRLQQRLETVCTTLGLPPEARPFRPHLTLARAQLHDRHGRTELAPLLQRWRTRDFGEVPVERIQLFQSQLHREGAKYTLWHMTPLQSDVALL